jgi:hypothetical protein
MSGKPQGPKAKGPKGHAAKAFEAAKKSLGPNPAKNNPWAFAALKRSRADDFSDGPIRQNLIASAAVLEFQAQADGIHPRPGTGKGGGAGAGGGGHHH